MCPPCAIISFTITSKYLFSNFTTISGASFSLTEVKLQMSIKATEASTVSFTKSEDSNSRLPIKFNTVSSTYILRILFSLIALSVSLIWFTCLIVFSTVSSRSSKFTGLVTKSKAPRFMAVRILSMSP